MKIPKIKPKQLAAAKKDAMQKALIMYDMWAYLIQTHPAIVHDTELAKYVQRSLDEMRKLSEAIGAKS